MARTTNQYITQIVLYYYYTTAAETGTGLNTGNKTKKVTNNYVLMGVGIGAGVLILIIMIVVIVRKQKQFQRGKLISYLWMDNLWLIKHILELINNS